MDKNKYILLTIDVEDWFQVENFKSWIPFSTWDQRELRVEKNIHNLLNLFDSIKIDTDFLVKPINPISSINPINGQEKKVKATFFVLAWIAERLPHLVREIHARGHEVASHGCNHQLPDQLSADELKQDLTDSKELLEDISGAEVVGYRAPSFAVNDSVLKIIEDCGYRYDSSYNSFGLHGRYGTISLNGADRKGIARKISESFFEIPVSNFILAGQTLPWGGGGYFRLLPLPLFTLGVKKILRKQDAYTFYTHPWELDPSQPKVAGATSNLKFRHYVNLRKTRDKLFDLINGFPHCRFISCSQYLTELV